VLQRDPAGTKQLHVIIHCTLVSFNLTYTKVLLKTVPYGLNERKKYEKTLSGEMFTEFWLGGPKGRGHWEDLSVGGP
jgi:hypothetical protein